MPTAIPGDIGALFPSWRIIWAIRRHRLYPPADFTDRCGEPRVDQPAAVVRGGRSRGAPALVRNAPIRRGRAGRSTARIARRVACGGTTSSWRSSASNAVVAARLPASETGSREDDASTGRISKPRGMSPATCRRGSRAQTRHAKASTRDATNRTVRTAENRAGANVGATYRRRASAAVTSWIAELVTRQTLGLMDLPCKFLRHCVRPMRVLYPWTAGVRCRDHTGLPASYPPRLTTLPHPAKALAHRSRTGWIPPGLPCPPDRHFGWRRRPCRRAAFSPHPPSRRP